MIAFINNHFLEEDKATLHVSDLALHRGYGIFDFFRTRNNIPIFLEDYLDRFYNSATLMRLLPIQSREELTALIYELIDKNNLGESGIKIICTGGYSPDGYQPAEPNLIILQQKLQLSNTGRPSPGIKVMTHEYQRDLPAAKSINYLMAVWLQQKLKEEQAADVLYYNQGIVSEFPRANVFIVTTDEKIVTPSRNILQGITRKKVLEIAAGKFTVEVREVGIEEIKSAAEVFMTSTTKRLLSITQVDDVVIGNGMIGPVTSFLHTAFMQKEEHSLQNMQGLK